jgi:hypothetical protein
MGIGSGGGNGTDVGAVVGGWEKESFSASLSHATQGAKPLSGRSVSDDSPRIPLPTAQGSGGLAGAPPADWGAYGTARPQSVEKRRWLARLQLLQGGTSTTQTTAQVALAGATAPQDVKIAKLAEADDDALSWENTGSYIYLEYLDWMGTTIFQGNDDGEISCVHCRKVLGSFHWRPTDRQSLGGLLDAPVIRIHKRSVNESALPFDQTPRTTPRPDDPLSPVMSASPLSNSLPSSRRPSYTNPEPLPISNIMSNTSTPTHNTTPTHASSPLTSNSNSEMEVETPHHK